MTGPPGSFLRRFIAGTGEDAVPVAGHDRGDLLLQPLEKPPLEDGELHPQETALRLAGMQRFVVAAGLEVDGEHPHPFLAAREGEVHPVPVASLRGPLPDVRVPLDPPARAATNDDGGALGPFRIGRAGREEEVPIARGEDPADGGRVFDLLKPDNFDAVVRKPRNDAAEPLEISLPAQVLTAALIAPENPVADPVTQPGDVPGRDGDPGGRLSGERDRGGQEGHGERAPPALAAGQEMGLHRGCRGAVMGARQRRDRSRTPRRQALIRPSRDALDHPPIPAQGPVH